MTRSTSHGRTALRACSSAFALGLILGFLPAVASAATAANSTSFAVLPGPLAFSSAPTIPTLPSVTLNGAPQTSYTQMSNFAIEDATGTGSGWNVEVQGNNGSGDSPVFAQYCPTAACGPVGYVGGGATLPTGSLTLNTASASWSTTNATGTPPTFDCSSAPCPIDAGPASPSQIITTPTGSGQGIWTANGFGGTSLALTTPSTLTAPASGELYRVDLMWTLNSGP